MVIDALRQMPEEDEPLDSYYLYGSEVSLYTGKARSYLRKKGLRHRRWLG